MQVPCTRRPRLSPVSIAILALVAALAVAGVVPARAADPDFPRLGLLGHVFGRGEPIVRPDGSLDPAQLDAIARRHTVVIDATPLTEYRPDVLAALRARRCLLRPGPHR